MIDHKHKCIFIHIPRCGGTSIEVDLVGKNWWDIEKTTKHLIASTAKKIYREYWDDYFKFSIIRNPWARMVSMMTRFPRFYGISLASTMFENVGRYIEKYPNIEIDPRSKSRHDKFETHHTDSVYLNILNEKLDFIGKLENIQEDYSYICNKIGVPVHELLNDPKHSRGSKHKHYTEYYDDETREQVAKIYAKDIEYFGYKFGE